MNCEQRQIAALFVEREGIYWDREGIDPWDEQRDARDYNGPDPIIAHPPCSRWCQLAHVNEKRYGYRVGDDGGCFASALVNLAVFGGVLEHPAYSHAWPAFELLRPRRGRWQQAPTGYWVTEISQVAYGCRARKRTWLVYVGKNEPPPVNWSEPDASAQVGFCANHGASDLPRMRSRESRRTPPLFAELLIGLARGAGL